MILQCIVADDSDRDATSYAIARATADWVAVIADDAMWGQRDWYPLLLNQLQVAPYTLLVPLPNEPAPDWQAAGPAKPDLLEQRAIAAECTGRGIVDVTAEAESAAGVAAVVRREDAAAVLRNGLAGAHELARARHGVGLLPYLYVIHHARD